MESLKMTWTELKDKIYYWDGSWRDIYVFQADKKDWRKWTNYVNVNYRVDWYNGKTQTNEDEINLKIVEEYWDGKHDLLSTARVFIGKTQVNAHFFTDTEIENDIDPREFTSLEDHKMLIKYMSDLSKLLDKEVVLTPESEPEMKFIIVNGDNVDFSTEIDSFRW